MTNEELYLSISQLMSTNSKEIELRMEAMENRLSNRIDNLDAEIHCIENRLDSEIKNVKLCLENVMLPRLQNIEACYTSTFERYKAYAEKYERLESDVEVVKSVVRKHNQIICPTSA